MNATNLATGENHIFNLTETPDKFFAELLQLSPDGANLRITMDEDDYELFESRFDGEHISVFIQELRYKVGADSSLTYRGMSEGGLTIITTYRKPD